MPASEYLSLPRAPETWLIKPLLPAGGSMLLYGDAKVGKSFAAIQLAAAIAGGSDQWLSFPLCTHGKVAYIQLDTPRSLWADRVEDLAKSGLPITNINMADRETLETFPFDILNPLHFQMLQEEVLAAQPAAVIIDTFRQVHLGDENDSTVMTNVVELLAAATYPAAMILISHARKPSYESSPDLLGDNRGSSAVVGRMDAIVRFTPRTMYYTGRGIEPGAIKLDRLDNGLWGPLGDEIGEFLQGVMEDDRYPTVKSKAKRLAELTGKREEACRSALRRAIGKGQFEAQGKAA